LQAKFIDLSATIQNIYINQECVGDESIG